MLMGQSVNSTLVKRRETRSIGWYKSLSKLQQSGAATQTATVWSWSRKNRETNLFGEQAYNRDAQLIEFCRVDDKLVIFAGDIK